ncbi:DUF4913 domain-containing protein [Streptomyces venezuelae]|uniref:DUF4913 domain-containing protein n=1 Tax=Streptomyces venezuelae TaxID=54571 RepID=UPI003445EB3E
MTMDEATNESMHAGTDEATDESMHAATDEEAVRDEETRASLIFPSVEEFVTEYLSAVVHRRTDDGSHVWCPDWWAHAEAVARLTALWRAFEYLSSDPALGMSNWWLHHADPHLAVLLDPHGPFHACGPHHGHQERPPTLPVTSAPPGHFDHPAFSLADEDPFRDLPLDLPTS